VLGLIPPIETPTSKATHPKGVITKLVSKVELTSDKEDAKEVSKGEEGDGDGGDSSRLSALNQYSVWDALQ
jgi:hypothetical protein